jgi:hypothetical protein
LSVLAENEQVVLDEGSCRERLSGTSGLQGGDDALVLQHFLPHTGDDLVWRDSDGNRS